MKRKQFWLLKAARTSSHGYKSRELLLAAEDSESKERWIQILRAGIAVVSKAASRGHMLQSHRDSSKPAKSSSRVSPVPKRPLSIGKSLLKKSDGKLNIVDSGLQTIIAKHPSVDPSLLSSAHLIVFFLTCRIINI